MQSNTAVRREEETGITGFVSCSASTASLGSRVRHARAKVCAREPESFIKINLLMCLCVRARARGRAAQRQARLSPTRGARTRFQRANREVGRPQSGVKCVAPCVWKCTVIYGLFAVMRLPY